MIKSHEILPQKFLNLGSLYSKPKWWKMSSSEFAGRALFCSKEWKIKVWRNLSILSTKTTNWMCSEFGKKIGMIWHHIRSPVWCPTTCGCWGPAPSLERAASASSCTGSCPSNPWCRTTTLRSTRLRSPPSPLSTDGSCLCQSLPSSPNLGRRKRQPSCDKNIFRSLSIDYYKSTP